MDNTEKLAVLFQAASEEERIAMTAFLDAQAQMMAALKQAVPALSPETVLALAGWVEAVRAEVPEYHDGSGTIINGIVRGLREHAAFRLRRDGER